jgi:hypothetical protein
MNHKNTLLATSIGLLLSGVSLQSHASLTSGATLSFTLGTKQVVACIYGAVPPCLSMGHEITDIVGSYFAVDNGIGGITPNEKTAIGSYNGIVLGTTQLASGSHTGSIDGSESPNIDAAFEFFAAVGMHQSTSPITIAGGSGDGYTLDMSGWSWTWNGLTNVPLVQIGNATVSCASGSSCSDTSSYTLDAAFHFNGANFTSAPYILHLEGTVASAVPVPATLWLFGSGLAGLAGVARRRKSRA